MADTTAPQPAPQAPPPIVSPEERQAVMIRNREAQRAQRRVAAVSRLNASRAETAPVVEQTTTQAEVVAPKPVVAPTAEAPKSVDAKPADPVKPAEVSPTNEDEATKRGLAQIEHARKRFLDEQAAAKNELEVQRAEIARLRQEAQGKIASIDELKKISIPDLLDKLGLDDARYTQLSRESYYRTAEGQKNPAAKQAVDEVRQRTSVSALEEQLADMRKELAEAKEAATTAQKLIFQREYANEWTEGALKEVPTDKPTLFGKLHAKNPRAARSALLQLGGEIEKEAGEAPAAAQVLAEYEKRQRAYLESQGFDVDALLAPSAPAKPVPAPAPAPKPARTLDVGATQITRPENVPQSREERRQNAIAKLRLRQRQTADQVP